MSTLDMNQGGLTTTSAPISIVSQGGATQITNERVRQIVDKGYTTEVDAWLEMGQLAAAAWCYLGDYLDEPGDLSHVAPAEWPWDGIDWKPTPEDPIRQLVKAGALVAAEIDRLLSLRRVDGAS